jgi:hypothetical protein
MFLTQLADSLFGHASRTPLLGAARPHLVRAPLVGFGLDSMIRLTAKSAPRAHQRNEH